MQCSSTSDGSNRLRIRFCSSCASVLTVIELLGMLNLTILSLCYHEPPDPTQLKIGTYTTLGYPNCSPLAKTKTICLSSGGVLDLRASCHCTSVASSTASTFVYHPCVPHPLQSSSRIAVPPTTNADTEKASRFALKPNNAT